MARTTKYTSINFNDIYEKNNPSPSSTSSPATANLSNNNRSTARTQGGMLVLTRPSPRPQLQDPQVRLQKSPPPPAKPNPDQSGFDSDTISLRPLGRTGSSFPSSSSTTVIQVRDAEPTPSPPLSKPDRFVPPHLRPGFVGREERCGQDVRKQEGFRNREVGHGQYGSPSGYADNGRPMSGGYEGMRRSGDSDTAEVDRPRSSGNRPRSSDNRPSTGRCTSIVIQWTEQLALEHEFLS